ncbi:MAG TPA: GNAT family N-acetyltransferase [Pseudonocardiaceae bacterium]|nr:GNAT family N-acetyltransferase [Pseudonocardiaceae bacterium]
MSTRIIRLPGDATAVGRIDTSFRTRRIFRVERLDFGFRLREHELPDVLRKRYHVVPVSGGIVAECDGEIAGYAELSYSEWNRRAVVEHLYVSATRRERGIGSALLRRVSEQARALGARCVWLETQNVNLPAVRFYLGRGFRLCGLDETLYDPDRLPGECALYLTLDIR